jgi:O6-methylguanine-DNA--protein-cysteine methyltransferase
MATNSLASKKWIVTRVDGKISAVSVDYRHTSAVLDQINRISPKNVEEISTSKITLDELFELSEKTVWEDLRLFGTPFQKKVWKTLFHITHIDPDEIGPAENPIPRLLCYTEVADLMGRAPAVRSVAHAISQNLCNVIVPCHLVIPKESMERVRDLEEEYNLFKWRAMYMVDGKIDYGEYSLGEELKRFLIQEHQSRYSPVMD